MLDHEHIKNHYGLMAVDLSRQKELDALPKAIQHVEFVGQLKNEGVVDADCAQFTFVLTTLEKAERRLKFSQGSVTVL